MTIGLSTGVGKRDVTHCHIVLDSLDAVRIELVLGAGSAFGLAHLGVLRALAERRHEIVALHGCSMGALVAGAVAWTCHRRGLDEPRWTRVPSLTRFWHVRPQPALRALLIQQTPSELAVLGVWLDANSLRSV